MSAYLQTIAEWMEHSWLGVAGRDIFWLFPAAEIVHFFGLCLFMGAMLIVDLRLLGFARRVSLQAALQFIPVAAFGLLLNLASGVVFLCAQPDNYWPSAAFRLKLLAILLGGANALWFKWMEAPRLAQLPGDADVDARTKIVGGLSLLIWLAVIVIGRFLPFVSVSTS
jgi:hypothetical protein